MKYQAVIGLEVHAELSTKSKIYCSCSTSFGAPINTHTCPVCTGMPGALPVLNKQVVHYAAKMGLATGCTVNQPVSYTHLDVYKRQVIWQALSIPLSHPFRSLTR